MGFRVKWTPWRLSFILGEKPRDCIFCTKVRENRDRENYILYRGAHNFLILNLYPYNNGHLMIVPYLHVPSLEDLPAEVAGELMRLLQHSLRVLRRALNPEGFNVGVNIGRVAGAGVADHVHLHVVPRWGGDTNFMPVLAGVRLIPELLDQTYDRLLAAGIATPEGS